MVEQTGIRRYIKEMKRGGHRIHFGKARAGETLDPKSQAIPTLDKTLPPKRSESFIDPRFPGSP